MDARKDTGEMNEAHMREVEKVLLYISDAREAAESSASKLAKDAGEDHLVVALQCTEQALGRLHTTLMQSTYFATASGPGESIDLERIRNKF